MNVSSGRNVEWLSLAPHAHAVQFYNHDEHLLDVLTRHIGTALVAGDAAITIATPAHRELLAARLLARGFDVAVPQAEGRYLAFDATETLARFMRGGWPDRHHFEEAAGEAVDRLMAAAGRETRIAAFGEMVALLWAGGNCEAALRLEELWNEFMKSCNLSLYCAYPMSLFHDTEAGRFLKVCAQHTCVFPAHASPAPSRLTPIS